MDRRSYYGEGSQIKGMYCRDTSLGVILPAATKILIFLLSYCLMSNYLGESPNMAVTMLNPRVIRAL